MRGMLVFLCLVPLGCAHVGDCYLSPRQPFHDSLPGTAIVRVRMTSVALEWASESAAMPSGGNNRDPRPYTISVSNADPSIISRCILTVKSAEGEKTVVGGPESAVIKGQVPAKSPELAIDIYCWFTAEYNARPISASLKHVVPSYGDNGLVNIATAVNEMFVACNVPLSGSDFLGVELLSGSDASRQSRRSIIFRSKNGSLDVKDATLDALHRGGDGFPVTLSVYGRIGGQDLEPTSVVGIDKIRQVRGIMASPDGVTHRVVLIPITVDPQSP